jgi:hypothetical protein
MKFHLVSAALIGPAVLLYLYGVEIGRSGLGATLFTLGVACEFSFWTRLAAARKARRAKVTTASSDFA